MSIIPQKTLVVTLDARGDVNRVASTHIGDVRELTDRFMEKSKRESLSAWGCALIDTFKHHDVRLDAVYFERPGEPLKEVRSLGVAALPTNKHNFV